MKLYSYWRSSASYRVRIALALKGLKAEMVPVDLLAQEQHGEAYRALNPQGRVPLLEEDGQRIAQSLAILEYLEETHPTPALLPNMPVERARVRGLAQVIACDIAPLNNSGALDQLGALFAASKEQKLSWIQHWVERGFTALEHELRASAFTGLYCHGDRPTLADCCLVPQVYNATRYHCTLDAYPTILRIAAECGRQQAFLLAHPDNQPDALHT